MSRRLKNYYNLSYLERETLKNNSMIYKALIKYGYSSFKLDILEYCEISTLISREQYYIDNLRPEYNILKKAGSLTGFKHSKLSIERIRASKLGLKRTEEEKFKTAINSAQALPVIVIDNNNYNITEFTSIRKASEFIGIHFTYLARSLNKKKFYRGKGFFAINKLK